MKRYPSCKIRFTVQFFFERVSILKRGGAMASLRQAGQRPGVVRRVRSRKTKPQS